jgi:hypothetical protein
MEYDEVTDILENLTEEDAQALLEADFDEELEKEAAAEVATSDFENALYAYGAFSADLEIEAADCDEDGFSKEAAEHFEAAEAEIAQAIEEGVEELGLDVLDDDLELHKTAMAAAAIIFEGYSDHMEKVAKSKGGGVMKTVAKYYKAGKKKAGEMYGAGKKHVGKHKGKYGVLAGAAAGYGASAAHSKMSKKASELTAEEIVDLSLVKQATIDLIADGVDMLEKRAAKKAGFMKTVKKMVSTVKKKGGEAYGYAKKKGKAAAKHVGEHSGKYGLAGGAAGGILAHKMMSKKKGG